MAITFIALAASLLLLVGAVLAWQSYVTEQEQAIATQRERAQRVSFQVVAYMQMQENALTELISVRGLSDLNQNQQSQLLSELVSFSDAFNTLALVGGNGQEKIVISSTQLNNQLQNLSTADEFTVPISTNQVYYGPVQFSENTGEPYMILSVPITNVRSGKATDVLLAEVRLKPVWDLLASSVTHGQESSTYIVDAQNRVVAHNNPSVVLRNTFFTKPNQDGVNVGVNGKNVVLATDKFKLGEEEFTIVTETPTAKAFSNIIRTELTIAFLLLVAMVIAGGLGWLAARQIVQPIEALVKSAQVISSGDLSEHVEVTRRDEIGNLAEAFNSMRSQLRDLIGNLEQRVTNRTKALETSADVSRRLTSILDPNELASAVVNQIQSTFNYYYAQIYLVDETGENLVLSAGTGDAGAKMMKRGHSLSKGRGLVGRAAESNKPVLVVDTSKDSNWLPNELLPDTKSEVAIPIAIGDKVLGVLDVQGDVTNDINADDITLLESLASQVAISIQNARQYEEVQESTKSLSEALTVAKLANWEYDAENDLFSFNDHFYSIFRTNVERVGGYKISSADYTRNFVHPEDAPLVGSEIQKVLESKERYFTTTLEHRIIFPDGEVGYISVRINVERDENGKIMRWYGANQDITERRRLEELNRKRAAQQEAINVITQRIQSATTIEEAMQVAARELGHALGNRQTLVALESSALGGNGKATVTE